MTTARKSFVLVLCSLVAVLASNVAGRAAVVGKAVDPNFSGLAGSGEINVTAFSIDNSSGGAIAASGFYMDFTSNGDTFGYTGRDGANEFDEAVFDEVLPFAIADDSTTDSDPIGIIKSGDFGTLFGVSDTTNDDTGNSDLPYYATWTFDISSAVGGLTVSVDAAAMGDFEDVDVFDFEYALGGGSFQPLFTSAFEDTPDPDGGFVLLNNNFPAEQGQIDLTVAGQMPEDLPPQNLYTLESGAVLGFKDPMSLEGVFLNNEFQTISKSIGSTTETTLQIRFTGQTNGGSEGFGFRNLIIEDGGAVGLDGDYNNDGTVDAADYTVWRDGDSPDSSQTGYDVWAANYGATSAFATAVPEPTAAVLALVALAGLATRRS